MGRQAACHVRLPVIPLCGPLNTCVPDEGLSSPGAWHIAPSTRSTLVIYSGKMHDGCCWSLLRAWAGSHVEGCACRAYDYDPEKMGKAEAVQEAPAITTKPDPSAMLPGHAHGAAAQARLTKALQENLACAQGSASSQFALSNKDNCAHHSYNHHTSALLHMPWTL